MYNYNSKKKFTKINYTLSYYKDSENELTFSDIITDKVVFTPIAKNRTLNLGFTRASVWLKIELYPEKEQTLVLDIRRPLNDVYFYSPDRYFAAIAGRSLPGDLKINQDFFVRNHYSFNLKPFPGEQYTCYLKLRNYALPLIVPVNIYDENDFFFSLGQKNFIFGIFIGFILIVLVINIIFHLMVDDNSYILFSLYILTVFLTLIGFYGFFDSLQFRNIRGGNLNITFCVYPLTYISAGFFINKYLELKKSRPRLNALLRIPLLTIAVLSLLSLFRRTLYFTVLAQYILSIPMILVYFFVIIFNMGKKDSPSGFFLISWSTIAVGAIVINLKDLSVMPFSLVTENIIWVSLVVHIFLMFMAIADRERSSKMEKEQADKKLIEERNRIAAEIHDSVGADFSVFVQELMVWPEKEYQARDITPRLKFYLQRIRDIVYMLNRDFDLPNRLESEINIRLGRLKGLKRYTLTSKIEQVGNLLGIEKCYHLLRIFDEWITNIVKHSQPAFIDIRLILGKNRVLLEIRDNGAGIVWNPGRRSKKIIEGQGLNSITWRSRSIGATVEAKREAELTNLFSIAIPFKMESAAKR